MSSDLSSNPTATAAGSPAPGGPVINAPAAPAKPAVAKGAWSPLAVPVFRALWLAYLISLIGTWAREAGGPWLMQELTTGRADQNFWVSLIQTAGNLPIAFLSIAAGVLADIYDRRRLLILTNVWMLIASLLLGIVTLAGLATPGVLLTFTCLLGIGAALSGPAFQYVIPELVPPGDLPLAIALNSVALNVARAVGPALGMLVVIFVGKWTDTARSTGASFLVNALAFVGVIWVLLRWHRGEQKQPQHRETLFGAARTAFQYTAHSPALRAILVRVAAFILCAVIVWAQLAVIAKKQLHGGEGTFLILMAAVGVGAVIGVICMPRLDKRFSTEGMVAICTVLFGLALIGLSQCKGRLLNIYLAGGLSMVVGFNWVIVPTNFNIATQRSVPGWVKGRAIAMYMTVLFGSFAVGSPIWGQVSSRVGISNASLIAGALVCLGALLVIPFPLTRAKGQNLTPANRPAPAAPADLSTAGPDGVRMVITYTIQAAREKAFRHHLERYLRPQRLRNGAARWRVQNAHGEPPGLGAVQFEEILEFAGWSDRMRFHARTTHADHAAEEEVRGMFWGAGDPGVRYERIAAPAFPINAAAATAEPPRSAGKPRHMPTPPPLIDWDRVTMRLVEEMDAVWNRVIRARFPNQHS